MKGRVATCGALVVASAMAAAWLFSLRGHLYYTGPRWCFGLSGGCVVVERASLRIGMSRAPDPGLYYDAWVPAAWAEPVRWVPWLQRPALWSLDGWTVHVPGWVPATAAGVVAAALARRFRLARPGHCRCGYSRAGLAPHAACPECGRGTSP